MARLDVGLALAKEKHRRDTNWRCVAVTGPYEGQYSRAVARNAWCAYERTGARTGGGTGALGLAETRRLRKSEG